MRPVQTGRPIAVLDTPRFGSRNISFFSLSFFHYFFFTHFSFFPLIFSFFFLSVVICFVSDTISCPTPGPSREGPEGPPVTPWYPPSPTKREAEGFCNLESALARFGVPLVLELSQMDFCVAVFRSLFVIHDKQADEI